LIYELFIHALPDASLNKISKMLAT
jgi:hypothetical protein